VSGPIVTTARRVLDLGDQVDDAVSFTSGDEDEAATELWIPATDWVDLGQPDQVTVTIRPGDTLNPKAAR
jgi:hypothetical protein